MSRLIFSIALIVLGAAACTDVYSSQTSTYDPVGGARSNADLQAATGVCVPNGSDTPDAYKQCMLAQGWQYGSTTLYRDVYPDPRHPGLACHDFMIFGIVGSSCSNF